MAEGMWESALAGIAPPGQLAVSMREMPERGMIDLRGLTSERKFLTAAREALGTDLPKAPRSSVAWGEVRILWLSVDQWLILCPRTKVAGIMAGLAQSLKGLHALAVEVSDMRAVIRLEGEGAREVLMKGTSLDLLSGDYGAGVCRRMRLAEIAALLHVVDENVFDIYVFRSYAHYAWEFLAAAAREPASLRLFGPQPAPL
jgi:sarcosine oxidase subunit gamma